VPHDPRLVTAKGSVVKPPRRGERSAAGGVDGRDNYVDSRRYASAQYSLGNLCANGQGVEENYVEAVKWYRLAADQEEIYSLVALGKLYSLGKGIDRSDEEAGRLFRAAIKNNQIFAQWLLDSVVSEALTELNYVLASIALEVLAESGDLNSQFRLAMFYMTEGKKIYGAPIRAVYWSKKLAEKGTFAAVSQFNLGLLYSGGKGIDKDYEEAAKWYRMAADKGLPEAQFNLAVLYQNGQGLLESKLAAADWYYKAGKSYLKQGKKDDALTCVDRINLIAPDHFLASKLLKEIYGEDAKLPKKAK